MMKKTLFLTALFVGMLSASYAQCDTIASICNKHITSDFISDGQQYRALLLDEEVAEFRATLYGGSTYRIAACSGMDDGNLLFRLYDGERNLIFDNKDYNNTPYWDFVVTSTIEGIIEAQLDPASASTGCAVMLIGFKQE